MRKYFLAFVGLLIIVGIVIFFFIENKLIEKPVDKIVSLPSNDAQIMKFKDTAQSKLGYLIKFMAEHDNFDSLFRYAVKSDFQEGDNHEHMWTQVDEIKDNFFIGRLANVPNTIKGLKYGDKVKIYKPDIEDWIIQDIQKNTEVGGFSRNYLHGKDK